MEDESIIAALRDKRARLGGKLCDAEARAIKLRFDLAAIDGALRVYDPRISPTAIRPILVWRKPTQFLHGQFSRLVLDAVRQASEPISVREIATQVARDHGMDTTSIHSTKKLVSKVRNTLARTRIGLASEKHGDVVLWRTAD
jgi:hypothetical protein